MSMQIPEEEQETIPKDVPVKAVVKKNVAKFFAHPTHYLFYVLLSGMLGGLFIGRDFSWKLYIALFALGIAELYLNSLKQNGEN